MPASSLEGIVLKPNMIVPGRRPRRPAPPMQQVAEATVRVLKNCVPGAVPGIAFLSGGQTDEEATANLDAMNKIGNSALGAHLLLRPCFAGRAAEGVGRQGQRTSPRRKRAFMHRAKMNYLAALGQWKADLEKKAA